MDLSDSVTERVRDPVQLRPRKSTELEQKVSDHEKLFLSYYGMKSRRTVILNIKKYL